MWMRHALMAAVLMYSPAHAAENLDAALSELANEVLSYFEAGPPKKIAIATMVHGDGTCSDLSERASDKFQGELFRVKASETSVIDRRSLSAIFREQKLVEDGTISPSGAAKIAAVEQVDAIVSGKMTQYGDDLEFVVSMLDAVSGTVIGFADSSFRLSTRDEDMLMTKNIARCGFAPAPGTVTSSGALDSTNNPTEQTGRSEIASAQFSSDVFDAEVVSLFYEPESGNVTFTLRFTNTSEQPIALSYIPDSLSIANNSGAILTPSEQWSGLRVCPNGGIQYCNGKYPERVSVLAAGTKAQLNFSAAGQSKADKMLISFTFELVVTPAVETEQTYKVVSVGFFDLVPTTH